MRPLLILLCCLALALIARAADQDDHKNKHSNQGPAPEQPHQQTFKPAKHTMSNASQTQASIHHNVSRAPFRNVTSVKSTNVTKAHVQHFNLGNKANPNIQNVTFRAGAHIRGSQNWAGPKYVVFRNYTPVWHERAWWIGHHSHIVFIFGGWYFWDAGYWYPAWGYAPESFYAYDGPIYTGRPEMDPGQVVANVQSALQSQDNPAGQPYYQGEVDGILGEQTRAALADYQNENGLTPTGAIDEPTLESLGIA